MPRTTRAVMDGGTYHVLTWGNNHQIIFHHEGDFRRYLQLLSLYLPEHQVNLYHFVLMPNHVHLILEVARAEALSKLMSGVNLSYSLFYRKRYRYSGHLWRGRFKSRVIDREIDLLECGRFVELNPIRAGLVHSLSDYAWSSYPVYAEGAANPLLSRHPLYEALGASPAERQERYRQFIHDGLPTQQPPVSSSRYGLIGQTFDPFKSLRDRFGFPSRRRSRGRPNALEVAHDA